MAANMSTIKWGIAGTGKICNDFVLAVHSLDRKLHVVTAVAGRNPQKAADFAKLHEIPEHSDDFIYLAKHRDINAVYIGVVNPQHYQIAKIMLQNGKNVLLEKPMCMNAKETIELVRIARQKKVILMEAIWSRFFPVYQELKRMIREGEIGEVFQVVANFGFPLTNIPRVTSQDLGGGSVLDLGIYVMQFAQFVFPGLRPLEIEAVGNLNNEDVDLDAGILLKFAGGKIAVLSCNAKAVLSNTAEIYGDKGFITIPNFWCPTTLKTATNERSYPLPQTSGTYNFFNSVGLSYEAEEFRRCISYGILESPDMTLDQSIELAQWRDIVHAKIGRKN